MLKDISFRLKLTLIMLIPLISFAVISLYLLNKSTGDLERIEQTLYQTSYKAQSLILNADRDMYQALTSYQQLQATEAVDRESLHNDFLENISQVEERVNSAQAILEEKELEINQLTGQSISGLLDKLETNFVQWADQAQKNMNSKHNTVDPVLQEQFEAARSEINIFGEMLDQYVTIEMERINKSNSLTAKVALLLIVVVGAIVLAVGFMIVGSLNKTVARVLYKTKQVAQGELHFESGVKYGKDEFGQIMQAIDEMIIKMRELVGQISNTTKTVASSATQLSHHADESLTSMLNTVTHIKEVQTQSDIQATVSGEVSIAMEEMAIGVQKMAEGTTFITVLAQTSNDEAEQGMTLLEQLKLQMEEMLHSIELLDKRITSLQLSSGKIGEITENISNIANQTSILSLNASIEAARAGESGRGFAVVASEIRKLAASSLDAADHIAELIADTTREIEQSTLYMSSTVEYGKQSQILVVEAATGFQQIVEVIRNVSEQLHDSSAITEQMSASSEEVAASMSQASSSAREVAGKANYMAKATDEQLSLVSSIQEATASLQATVGELDKAVHQFKLD